MTKKPKSTLVELPTKLVDQAKARLDTRGLTLSEYLALHLRLMVRVSPSHLTLRDEMPFGKYRGEIVETVCRADPVYMTWLVSQNGKTGFDTDVIELLNEMAD